MIFISIILDKGRKMVLTPREIAAMARRCRDYDDLMLELSGVRGRTPRFLTQAQVERIREEAGLVSSHETPMERAWREYLEFSGQVQRQLYTVNRAIERALIKSERRIAGAQKALADIRRRATVNDQGRKVYRTGDRQRGFTDDGEQLSQEEFDRVQWDPTAPTWEQRVRARQRLEQAKQAHEQILQAKERADYYTQ